MRADRMFRRVLLLAVLAAGAACTPRDPPQVFTSLSDDASTPSAAGAPWNGRPWRLRLTRL